MGVRRPWDEKETEREREEGREDGSLIVQRCSRIVREEGRVAMGAIEVRRGLEWQGREVRLWLDEEVRGEGVLSRREEEERQARRRCRSNRKVLLLEGDGYDTRT